MRGFLGVGTTGAARRRNAMLALDYLIGLAVLLFMGTQEYLFGHGTDLWLAPDKLLHVAVTIDIAALTFALCGVVSAERPTRLFAAIGMAVFAGVAKEALDMAGIGTPSLKDVAWDAVGMALAPFVLSRVDVPPAVQVAGAGSVTTADDAAAFATSARSNTTVIAA